MIIRPDSDAELAAQVCAVLSDGSIPLDTRALVALLLLDRTREACPDKAEMLRMIGSDGGLKIGIARSIRMMGDAVRARYFERCRGRLPGSTGKAGRYWFIVRGPAVRP